MIRAATVILIVGSAYLAFRVVRRGTKPVQLSLRRDLIRLSIQVAVPLVVSVITGVTGGLFGIATIVVGLALGYLSGTNTDVATSGDRTLVSRNRTAMIVWVSSIVVMQIGALVNRTGAMHLGLAVAWLAAAFNTGTLIGRGTKLRQMSAVSILALLLVASGSSADAVQEGWPVACPDAVGDATAILDLDGNPQHVLKVDPQRSSIKCFFAVNWDGQVVDPETAKTAGVIDIYVEWSYDGEIDECASKTNTLEIKTDDGVDLEYVLRSPTHRTHVSVDARIGWAVPREVVEATTDAMLSQAETQADPCGIAKPATQSFLPCPDFIGDHYRISDVLNEPANSGSHSGSCTYFSAYRDDPVIYRYTTEWWVDPGDDRTPPGWLGCGNESTDTDSGSGLIVEVQSADSYATSVLRVEELDHVPDDALAIFEGITATVSGAASACAIEVVEVTQTTVASQASTTSSSQPHDSESPTTTAASTAEISNQSDGESESDGLSETDAALAVLVGFMGLMALAGESMIPDGGDTQTGTSGAESTQTDLFTDEQIEDSVGDALAGLQLGDGEQAQPEADDGSTSESAGDKTDESSGHSQTAPTQGTASEEHQSSVAQGETTSDDSTNAGGQNTWDGSNSDGGNFLMTESAEAASADLQTGLDTVEELENALDELGIEGEDRDKLNEHINPVKDHLGTIKEGVDRYQQTVEGATEIVDDTERRLADYDLPRDVQDGVIFIRWMIEAGGQYLGEAVDTYMTPLTERLANWFGGEASDYSQAAVPVDEAGEELSETLVKASQLVKGGENYYGQEGYDDVGGDYSIKDDLRWEFNK